MAKYKIYQLKKYLKEALIASDHDARLSKVSAANSRNEDAQYAKRRLKFQHQFFKDSASLYNDMMDEGRSKVLTKLMFGKTIAAHKTNAPKFLKRFAREQADEHYYRTDSFQVRRLLSPELKKIVLDYDDTPDFKHYSYIPIMKSHSGPIEELIAQHAPKYRKNISILINLYDVDSTIEFIKVPKSDERFFYLKKILALFGIIPYNFTFQLAKMGAKATPWQIAAAVAAKANEDEAPDSRPSSEPKKNKHFEKMKVGLPKTVVELKKSNILADLIKFTAGKTTDILAECLFNLIQGIPDGANVSVSTIERMAALIDVAGSLQHSNYDRFAFITHCIIHEISILADKGIIQTSFAAFKQETIQNAISKFGLQPLADNSNYQYVALPCNSGTNAMALALQLAKAADPDGKVAEIEKGDIYFEYAQHGAKEITTKNSTSNIYLITAGVTVYQEVYRGVDVNKLITSIVAKGLTKPTTIIIDSTSGLYKDLKIDAPLMQFIESGQITILVHESHQKFGMLHSDQAQYGRVFGVCSKKHYSSELIKKYEVNAEKDLKINLDMQIGSYISVHSGELSEQVKERQFRNGKLLSDFLERNKVTQNKKTPNHRDIDDKDGSLFVYGNQKTSLGRAIIKHLEHRGSFGHFNTTWTDVGPYFRISPSASDETDILIEGTELVLASRFKTKSIFHMLKESVIHDLMNGHGDFSQDQQIFLCATLHALKNMGYKPSSSEDRLIWKYAVKFMEQKATSLVGRKCFDEVIEYRNKLEMIERKPSVLNIALQNVSSPFFSDEKSKKIYALLQRGESFKVKFRYSANERHAIEGTLSLISAQLDENASTNDMVKELMKEPKLAVALVDLQLAGLLNRETYQKIYPQGIVNLEYTRSIHQLASTKKLNSENLNLVFAQKYSKLNNIKISDVSIISNIKKIKVSVKQATPILETKKRKL